MGFIIGNVIGNPRRIRVHYDPALWSSNIVWQGNGQFGQQRSTQSSTHVKLHNTSMSQLAELPLIPTSESGTLSRDSAIVDDVICIGL
jgi:hypothetical protein